MNKTLTPERIKRLRLMDNFFMKVFFKGNIEAVQLILRIVLDRSDIVVESVDVESELSNLEGRNVILDVHARDGNGEEFDVEIQRASEGAIQQRAGYHLSMMHTHMLGKGENFDQLKDAYVIFITETDTIGNNEPISVFETANIKDHKHFDDKRHIIYVNGEARCSTTELGRLMEDFFCENPDDINYPEIRKRIKYLKETEAGGREMMDIEEEILQEGRSERNIEVAINLIELGTVSLEDIAKATGLDIEKVRELAGQKAV